MVTDTQEHQEQTKAIGKLGAGNQVSSWIHELSPFPQWRLDNVFVCAVCSYTVVLVISK